MKILALRMMPSHQFVEALREVKRRHPQSEISALLMTAGGGEETAELLGPQQVIVAGGGISGRWRRWQSLRQRRFDQVLVFARPQGRPSPRAWPAYAVALTIPAAERRLVMGQRTRRIGWVYLLTELALCPIAVAGAFVLWSMPLALAALVLAVDAVCRAAGSRRLRP